MQVYGKGNFFTGQDVEIMGNVVSGGTTGTIGVVTLNENEVTLKNSQPNCGDPRGVSPLYNIYGPLMPVNCYPILFRLQVKTDN